MPDVRNCRECGRLWHSGVPYHIPYNHQHEEKKQFRYVKKGELITANVKPIETCPNCYEALKEE